MDNKEKALKWDELAEQLESGVSPVEIEGGRYIVISEDIVRWMTEGTSPNFVPRSDCG
jgi:hypothetical protein